MTVISRTNPVAHLSHSCYVHYFNLFDVSATLAQQAVEALVEAGYTGLSIKLIGDEVHTIYYESRSEWEARKEYGEQIASDISQVLKDLI